MGYFSNGTEGMIYTEQWCDRCKHNGNGVDDPWCPIWNAHLQFCHGQEKTRATDAILDLLIPRSADGLSNEECRFFTEAHTTPLLD